MQPVCPLGHHNCMKRVSVDMVFDALQGHAVKILIVKLSAIGDVIHTLPALNAIREHYPQAHITWLVEAAAADLVDRPQGPGPCDRIQAQSDGSIS